MKALFISNDPALFDGASEARARMRAYAAAIGELHILSSAGRGAKDEQDGHLFLHPVRAGKLFRSRTLAHRARALIAKHGIDVVSAQDPFEHGLAALQASRGTGARLHVQVHTDFLSPWFIRNNGQTHAGLRMALINRYRRRVADRVLPAANGIRTVSERVKASLEARYGSRIGHVSVIPIAVPTDAPPPAQLPAHVFNFSLIAVGRLEPEKRIGDILQALQVLAKQYPMIGLFVVGSGRERGRLERMTHALGLTGRVIFLGERRDARSLIARAQAFIQASAYEGYGRTLIEAALAKVPIITTDVGVAGELFKNHEHALVSPVADIAILARNISICIEDTKARHELPMHAEAAARAHLVSVGDLSERIAADLSRLMSNIQP